MAKPVHPGDCKHCGRPVIWGRLQNGRYRSFEPTPTPTDQVPEPERYAYSHRAGTVVDLVGVPNPPAQVHIPHYCTEYAHRRIARVTPADLTPLFQPPDGAPNA